MLEVAVATPAVETPATPEAPTGQNVPTQPNATEAAKDAAKATEPKPELYELKVNGKTLKVTKEDLIRRAQLSEAATERFEQAAAKEKQMNEILARTKQNPIKALMDTGLTKDEAREAFENWYSTEYIEPEALSPEQRELKKAQDELGRYKAMEKEYLDKQKAEQEAQEIEMHRGLLQKQIIDAIEEHKLPKKKFTVARMAHYMKLARDKGFEAPMDLIAQQVKDEMAGINQEIPEDADYEKLVDIYGEAVVKRIISEHLKFIRTKRNVAAPAVDQNTELKSGKLSMREADLNLRKLMGR